MRNKSYTQRLREFIDTSHDRKIDQKVILSPLAESVFKNLKTNGERAIKGREITKSLFEVKNKATVSFLMLLEGRHSVSVGNQIVRRFDDDDRVESAEVFKTKKGACVVLMPKDA